MGPAAAVATDASSTAASSRDARARSSRTPSPRTVSSPSRSAPSTRVPSRVTGTSTASAAATGTTCSNPLACREPLIHTMARVASLTSPAVSSQYFRLVNTATIPTPTSTRR